MTVSRSFPYLDPGVAVDNRVQDLLSRLSLEDKAGLMFYSMMTTADPDIPLSFLGVGSLREMVTGRRINHFNLVGALGTTREVAGWTNNAQEIARGAGWGIPLSIAMNPSHSSRVEPTNLGGQSPFSAWPSNLGIAALRSPERMREYAAIVRRELAAVGVRVTLEPQLDLATEPRSPRIYGMYGEDVALATQMGVAFIQTLQQNRQGKDWVAAMGKHFPGGGPQRNGEDPHFAYGKDQVYPGEKFELHLEPFSAAVNAGLSQIMPSYSKPVGTRYEELGIAFNRSILTEVLRERLGFEGIICTDWGILQNKTLGGQLLVASAWGAEDLSTEDRILLALEAGVDQFGGEQCPEIIVSLVRSGRLSETRIDASVRRLLRAKFDLGLFDDPLVDVEAAVVTLNNPDSERAGFLAQSESITLLKNQDFLLPLRSGILAYCEGIEPTELAPWATAVDTPEEADCALVRLDAPFELRTEGMEPLFRAGSLEFSSPQIEHLRELAQKLPVVADVYLDRPAILTGILPFLSGLTVSYASSTPAWLSTIFGESRPQGRLPFDLPRSAEAIEAAREDVPFDTVAPLFQFGDGLSYPE